MRETKKEKGMAEKNNHLLCFC